MSKIVIKMSAEELDKFIGGSTEAGLELKHGILNTFAKAYLKPLINEPSFQHALSEVKEAAKKAMAGEIGEWKQQNCWDNSEFYVLSDEVKDRIKTCARIEIEEIFRKELRAAVHDEFNRCIDEMEGRVTEKVKIAIRESAYAKLIGRIDDALSEVNDN